MTNTVRLVNLHSVNLYRIAILFSVVYFYIMINPYCTAVIEVNYKGKQVDPLPVEYLLRSNPALAYICYFSTLSSVIAFSIAIFISKDGNKTFCWIKV